MASQVEICNSALVQIGADRISTITQDTRRAILLNAVWDQSVNYVLRAHPWNFALKRATLTPTATTPEWGYQYQYDCPNDMLRVWQTDPEDIEFNVESDADGNAKVIRSDETSLDVLYIWANDNPAMWDACFAEALAMYLGYKVAYALFQSLALQESVYKKYKELLSEARSVDGSEGIMRTFESTQFVDARKRTTTFNGKV